MSEETVPKSNELTNIEKFVLSWLRVTPRLATIADKLNASRLHRCATALTVHKIINSIYRKLNIDSRHELTSDTKPQEARYD